MRGLYRIARSCLARAILAAVATQASFGFVRASAQLGIAAGLALASLSAAAAILLLVSLSDDDVRLRRLVGQTRAITRRLSSATKEAPNVGDLRAIEMATGEVADLVASLEQRLLHRHPVSGLPTREPLFRVIAGDPHGVLGVIHLTDLERMQAFDEVLAERVLVTLTERVVQMLGPATMIAQVDRGRLAIWFGGEALENVARTKLQAIGYALGEAILIDGREVLPEVRVSDATMPEHGLPPAALLARAALLRDDRTTAAPQAQAGPADALAAAQERYALEQDLRRAVDRGELQLAYQPLVDAPAGAVCGAEALLRWRHPVHGPVPPSRFVPIMEASGLADEIGLWAINAACREAAVWRRERLGPLRVAVNISGHQLERGDLATLIERTLARHSLSSATLEIELTETIATGDADRVAGLFTQLRRLGVALAIDDFGTGYSGFSTLRTLRFDKIKIDREFVTAVDSRRDSQAICRAILALGQGMGIRVLAEGVETAGEYGWLRAQGCRYFQGYYFAKPLEPSAFQAFVRDTAHLSRLLAPASSDLFERLRA
jgi:Amt family ammonium transporter